MGGPHKYHKRASYHRIDGPVGHVLFGYSLTLPVVKELPLADWTMSPGE
jgi:hypothetical protein